MLECTIIRVLRYPIVDLRTQWMVLSAQNNNPEVASYRDGTLQHQSACHRRKAQRHRRQQGCRRSSSTPSSRRAPPSPMRLRQPSLPSAGTAVPAGTRSRSVECATLASVRTFSTISNAYVHMTRATCLAEITIPDRSAASSTKNAWQIPRN